MQHIFLSLKCLSRTLAPPSQLSWYCVEPCDLCNHRVPRYPKLNQLVQRSCKPPGATKTTCPPNTPALPTLTASGCNPPSFIIFVPETYNQHLPACQLSEPVSTRARSRDPISTRSERKSATVCFCLSVVVASKESIGQSIPNVSCRAASLPVIGCAECRRILK